eukprot:CFRG4596T1
MKNFTWQRTVKSDLLPPPPYRDKSVRKPGDLPMYLSSHILLSQPSIGHVVSATSTSTSASTMSSKTHTLDNTERLDWLEQEVVELNNDTVIGNNEDDTINRTIVKENLGQVDKTKAAVKIRPRRKSRCQNKSSNHMRESIISSGSNKYQITLVEAATESYRSILWNLRRHIPPAVFARALGVVIGKVVGCSFIAGITKGHGSFIKRVKGQWSPPALLDISYKTFGIGGLRGEFVLLMMANECVNELHNTGKVELDVDVNPVSGLLPTSESYYRSRDTIIYARHSGLCIGLASSPAHVKLKPEAVHQRLYGEHISTRSVLNEAWPKHRDLPLVKLAKEFDRFSLTPRWE